LYSPSPGNCSSQSAVMRRRADAVSVFTGSPVSPLLPTPTSVPDAHEDNPDDTRRRGGWSGGSCCSTHRPGNPTASSGCDHLSDPGDPRVHRYADPASENATDSVHHMRRSASLVPVSTRVLRLTDRLGSAAVTPRATTETSRHTELVWLLSTEYRSSNPLRCLPFPATFLATITGDRGRGSVTRLVRKLATTASGHSRS